MLMHAIEDAGTNPADYQVKIFGAGRQFPDHVPGSTMNIPERNLQVGLELLERNGLAPIAMHVGGSGHRQVILDISSGVVWLNHVGRAAEEVPA